MTIAEKLLKIDEGVEETIALNAELEQTLYGTDTDKTLSENVEQTANDFQAIKDKIVEHGVEVADGTKTSEYASKVDDVFDAGKKAEHDAFWEPILSPAIWPYNFCGSSWNDDTFYPTKDIKVENEGYNLFYLSRVTDLVGRLRECGVTLDTSGITRRSDAMFAYARMLTSVPYLDLRNAVYSLGVLNGMFGGCEKLKTIEGIHLAEDGSQELGAACFSGCYELEDVRFYGTISKTLNFSPCRKLSKASFTSIINALSATTIAIAVTFTKTAVNNAFETSDGAADGSTSTEWTTLIGTKTNWTISLV